jgi:hypothetical protein
VVGCLLCKLKVLSSNDNLTPYPPQKGWDWLLHLSPVLVQLLEPHLLVQVGAQPPAPAFSPPAHGTPVSTASTSFVHDAMFWSMPPYSSHSAQTSCSAGHLPPATQLKILLRKATTDSLTQVICHIVPTYPACLLHTSTPLK